MQIFGRLGQALLALYSWYVFSLYATTSMETAPATFGFYRTIFLESGPSLWSTINLIRDFTSRKGLRSRTATTFMIATMLFIVAFPTLGSAMTGYTSAIKSYVPDHQDNNLIRFDRFDPVMYIIHDGSRAGLQDEYAVTMPRDRAKNGAQVNVSTELRVALIIRLTKTRILFLRILPTTHLVLVQHIPSTKISMTFFIQASLPV